MQKTSILLIASISLTIPLGLSANDEVVAPETDVLPALKILPEGSILNNVRVPRFNKDLSPASLLIAKKLKVITKSKIAGEDVEITLFNDEGSKQAHTLLSSVTYNQSTGIIHAPSNLTIDGENFAATSQGLALNWEKRQGFLLGKNHIIFYLNQAKPMTSSSPKNNTPKLKKKIAVVATLAATIPTLLTAAELKEIDALAKPMAQKGEQLRQVAKVELDKSNSASSEADAQISTFKTQVGTKAMTIQNEAKPTPPKGKQPGVKIQLTSDGGTFFDAEQGLAVSSKNIVITHPQYKLTCSDELKIFLKKAAAKKAKDQPGIVDPMSNLGDIDRAIATGNVVITGKDKNGKLVTAKAETANYNHATGVFILKGGYPSVKHGNSTAKILDKNGYIIMTPNMSIRLEGKNEVITDIPSR